MMTESESFFRRDLVNDRSSVAPTRSIADMWSVRHLLDQPTALTPTSSSFSALDSHCD